MSPPRIVPCPHCGKAVEWTDASRFRPFCSERCKLIDLGAWATEAYRVPTEDLPELGDVPPKEPGRDTPSRR